MASAVVKKSSMHAFAQFVSEKFSLSLSNYQDLHRWSIEQYPEFWASLAEFLGFRWHDRPKETCQQGAHMWETRWFPGGTFSFAEHFFKQDHFGADKEALVGIAEGRDRVSYSHGEVERLSRNIAKALAKLGVRKGDRVAAVMANVPETLLNMLGATHLGAIWASCSPDFGEAALWDRLYQVQPKVIFATPSYVYNQKIFKTKDTILDMARRLKPSPAVIWMDHLNGLREWHEFCECAANHSDVGVRHEFNDPLYILFSSGTTGVPKCIVHRAGGVLLQHLKEHVLHCDIVPQETLCYFTTCGWMMWNWMVSGLAAGARLLTFDGAPLKDARFNLWKTAEEERVNILGASPKFLASSSTASFALPSLEQARLLLSTGSPLGQEQGDWVAQKWPQVRLSSVSGGTDLVSCFMLGHPLSPVYRADEIQGPGLGMAVEAWDEDGKSVANQKGELVCTKPFVTMPLGFWGDDSGEKYRKAYFDFYPSQEVWRHGDFIEVTPRGGILVYGRSDATLNPGGVRIGTAELYRQVETLPFVADSLAATFVSQGDAQVILFVKLKNDEPWHDEFAEAIKQQIRAQLTARHVPHKIFAVKDIPYTRSGKKMEILVNQLLAGERPANLPSVANGECLGDFERIVGKLRETQSKAQVAAKFKR